MSRHSTFLTFVAAGLLTSCSERAAPVAAPAPQPSETSTTTPAASQSLREACELLSSEEIESVLGEAVKETKKLEETEKGLVTSVCQFSLPTLANSILLRLVQRAPGPEGRDPRQVWNEAFAPENLVTKQTGREEVKPPDKIPGVGEEAFWRGNAKGGALYVLKGNSYIFLHLFDSRDRENAIKKCSALAELALKRL